MVNTATRKRIRLARWLGAAVATLAIPLAAAAQIVRPQVPPAARGATATGLEVDAPYMRVLEERGPSVALQIASRAFAPPRDGMPAVTLVGVAHIGDADFYAALQALLDEHSVVLYESVRPPGAVAPGGETDAERTESTRRAMGFAASLVAAYEADSGSLPADLDALRRFSAGLDPRLGHFAAEALRDGWGNDVVYERSDDGTSFTLRSLGADGIPGGDGDAADIDATRPEGDGFALASDDNLQRQLARALGLEFQLDAIDYGSAGFRPADMAMDDLERAFADEGVDFGMIEGSLAGTSLPARLVRFLLGAMRFIDQLVGGAVSDAIKVVMIEILADEAVLDQSLAHFGKGFKEVIVDRRNEVALDALGRIIDQEPQVESVAIFYGAAHMDHMGRQLAERFGYAPKRDTWMTAFEVNLDDSVMTAQDLDMIRRMIRQQLRAMGRR